MELQKIKHVHCIGIGGIGVSAIARLMVFFGKEVSGSDLSESTLTQKLIKAGVRITYGKHQAKNIPAQTDLVVYSNAIPVSNPEFNFAKTHNITRLSYPEILGELLAHHIPIVISGTHGKSTTSAMLASIFITAGLDPWAVIGTRLNFRDFDENVRVGLGRHFIVEGDEYRAAFLNYQPFGLIINNIESDHLDFYKSYSDILKTFKKLIASVPRSGFIVANADDPNVMKALASAKSRVITFGLTQGDYQATHILQHGELTRCSIKGPERFDIALRVPGIHNVKNALAATVMSIVFQIPLEKIKQALLEFPGVWRRFEIKADIHGTIIIDDYAHHPTEIRATLSTARKIYNDKKIWCIFQPHSVDRTTYLFDDFAAAFADCDQVILMDIYQVAGRDHGTHKTVEQLAKAIRDTGQSVMVIKQTDEILKYCKNNVTGNDVILTVGAGTVTELSDRLLKAL